jgi:hypothetical protein
MIFGLYKKKEDQLPLNKSKLFQKIKGMFGLAYANN